MFPDYIKARKGGRGPQEINDIDRLTFINDCNISISARKVNSCDGRFREHKRFYGILINRFFLVN
jgi:hypothetical protein